TARTGRGSCGCRRASLRDEACAAAARRSQCLPRITASRRRNPPGARAPAWIAALLRPSQRRRGPLVMTVEERHEPAPAGPGPRPRVAGTTVSAAGRPESVPVSDGFFRTLVETASEGVIAID